SPTVPLCSRWTRSLCCFAMPPQSARRCVERRIHRSSETNRPTGVGLKIDLRCLWYQPAFNHVGRAVAASSGSTLTLLPWITTLLWLIENSVWSLFMSTRNPGWNCVLCCCMMIDFGEVISLSYSLNLRYFGFESCLFFVESCLFLCAIR